VPQMTKKAPAGSNGCCRGLKDKGRKGDSLRCPTGSTPEGRWQFLRTSIPLRASGAPPFQELPETLGPPDFKKVGVKPVEL
jgi:hypothetical protein